MKVIVINGKPTSGKSTFVKLCEEINEEEYVIELSMVDYVKKIAKAIGWDGEKNAKGRKFLADLKQAIESYDKNIIYNRIDSDIYYYSQSWLAYDTPVIFFINARNPSDINYLVKKYNATSLFIDNPNVPMVESNSEDKGVENYKYDVTIVNDGTIKDLKNKAERFLKTLNNT